MKIGEINRLKVLRTGDLGFYLIDEEDNEVLLPTEYISDNLKINDEIDVFVYNDFNNKLVATTLKPKVKLGEYAYLQVVEVNNIGAFLDWGLPKDLLIPFAHQREKLQIGDWYFIYLDLDKVTNRLFGTTKIENYFIYEDVDVEIGQVVDLLLMNTTDLGMKTIVNNKYSGLIFKSDLFKNVRAGDRVKGYVKQIREDGKLDILLEPMGYKKSIDVNCNLVISALKSKDGFLTLTDKSAPNLIKRQVGLSKKAFKRAIGHLYKEKIIDLSKTGIKLLSYF